jgi:hypothetical protein
MNLCKTCKCRCEKEYCFRHAPRKKIPQIRRFKTLSPKDNIERQERIKESLLMKEFFLGIWKERPHYSEISNTFLGNECLTTFMHHILLKSKHPQAMYDEECIIILTQEEHVKAHSDMYFYPEINRRREVLLLKYEK